MDGRAEGKTYWNSAGGFRGESNAGHYYTQDDLETNGSGETTPPWPQLLVPLNSAGRATTAFKNSNMAKDPAYVTLPTTSRAYVNGFSPAEFTATSFHTESLQQEPQWSSRYLPLTIQGKQVVFHEGGQYYRLSNEELKATKTTGILFRKSKELNDIDRDRDGAAWNTSYVGIAHGGVWLEVRLPVQDAEPEVFEVFDRPVDAGEIEAMKPPSPPLFIPLAPPGGWADAEYHLSEARRRWPSLGSVGHPNRCAMGCKYHAKAKGCKDGFLCKCCHFCSWHKYDVKRKQQVDPRFLTALARPTF